MRTENSIRIFAIFLSLLLLCCAFFAPNVMAGPELAKREIAKEETASPWWIAPTYNPRNSMTGDWGGFRDKLSDEGILVTSTYVCDVLADPVGGMNTGTQYNHSWGGDINFDLEKLLNLVGLQFHISSLWRYGGNLSKKNIGNDFTVSSIYGSQVFKFYGLYLDQSLFDGKLDIRIGRQATGDDFAASQVYQISLNNAIDGNPVSLPQNSFFSAYPTAVWGARMIIKPFKDFYSLSGIYNADDRVGRDEAHGLDFSLRLSQGIFYAQEFGYTPNNDKDSQGLPGHYKIGAVYDSGNFYDFYQDRDGGSWVVSGKSPRKIAGNYGFYALQDQMVYREGGPGTDQGLVEFVAITWATPNINKWPFFIDGGLIYKGLIPGRDNDLSSFGFAYGHYSPNIAHSERDDRDINGIQTDKQIFEMMFDFSYRVQVTPWMYVQPDIQYIVRPKGTGKTPNAMVIGSRLGITF
ncbi:MAG: carbohydrate porin [Candidatus Omnitrophica bacterium]|nr:carbohydrate porin [Candidatus Omnitrophota bacterium]